MAHAIAPEIFRQRLLIEGRYEIDVDESMIRKYFDTICKALNLAKYDDPIIFSPGGSGKETNQGYDAFIPLIDSGIALYVWTRAKFMSTVIYTCKGFDNDNAIRTTEAFFKLTEKIYKSF